MERFKGSKKSWSIRPRQGRSLAVSVAIQHCGADVGHTMSTLSGPSHPLLLGHASIGDLVHAVLCPRGRRAQGYLRCFARCMLSGGGSSDDLRPRKATLSLFVDEHLSCSANVEDARIGAVPSILSVTRGLSARALLRELGDLVHIVLCDEVRPSQQRTAASDFIAVSFIEPEQID
jgi:hypothetical protein